MRRQPLSCYFISVFYLSHRLAPLVGLIGCVNTNADTFKHYIFVSNHLVHTGIYNTLLDQGWVFLECMTTLFFLGSLFVIALASICSIIDCGSVHEFIVLPFVFFSPVLCPSQKASSRLPLSDPHQPLPGAAGLEPGVSGQLLAVLLGSIWPLCGRSIHNALLPPGVIHLDGIGGR